MSLTLLYLLSLKKNMNSQILVLSKRRGQHKKVSDGQRDESCRLICLIRIPVLCNILIVLLDYNWNCEGRNELSRLNSIQGDHFL